MKFSTFIKSIMVAFTAFAGTSAHAATVIYADDFDAYGPYSILNWQGGPDWTVSRGSVDLVQNVNRWGIDCLDNIGACIDLDGSTRNAGVFTRNDIFLSGGSYQLSFWLSGNQRRHRSDSVFFNFGDFASQRINLRHDDPWQQFTYNFVANQSFSDLSFAAAGRDNVGALLDRVVLSAVPEPATWLMMIMGFGLVGAASRRRKKMMVST